MTQKYVTNLGPLCNLQTMDRMSPQTLRCNFGVLFSMATKTNPSIPEAHVDYEHMIGNLLLYPVRLLLPDV